MKKNSFHWNLFIYLFILFIYLSTSIELEITNGQLVAMVGSLGSGKSSLLSAILGNMLKLNGNEMNVSGPVAYAPQQPWIQNATIQQNILFGRPMDKEAFDSVLKSCSLLTDLDLMPAAERTEIGERGVNLSGEDFVFL